MPLVAVLVFVTVTVTVAVTVAVTVTVTVTVVIVAVAVVTGALIPFTVLVAEPLRTARDFGTSVLGVELLHTDVIDALCEHSTLVLAARALFAVVQLAGRQRLSRGHRALVFVATSCDAGLIHLGCGGLASLLTGPRLASLCALEEGMNRLPEAGLAVIALCRAGVEHLERRGQAAVATVARRHPFAIRCGIQNGRKLGVPLAGIAPAALENQDGSQNR
jgi:hypothetical protein